MDENKTPLPPEDLVELLYPGSIVSAHASQNARYIHREGALK